MSLKKNKSFIIGCIITGVILLMAIVGLFWTPYSTTKMSLELKFAPPSIAHIFGCDNYGRDIFSRADNSCIRYGGRNDHRLCRRLCGRMVR